MLKEDLKEILDIASSLDEGDTPAGVGANLAARLRAIEGRNRPKPADAETPTGP